MNVVGQSSSSLSMWCQLDSFTAPRKISCHSSASGENNELRLQRAFEDIPCRTSLRIHHLPSNGQKRRFHRCGRSPLPLEGRYLLARQSSKLTRNWHRCCPVRHRGIPSSSDLCCLRVPSMMKR